MAKQFLSFRMDFYRFDMDFKFYSIIIVHMFSLFRTLQNSWMNETFFNNRLFDANNFNAQKT